jgi:aspartyl-tRNA(Asn)/glutamyl-tRNA(Gln) amidotransferase subunit A
MEGLIEQAAAVRTGTASPVELVETALQAMEGAEVLNAFTVVLAEEARAAAKALEGTDPVGPLHGVPVAVKDLFDLSGAPTTGCCAAYAGRLAAADSAVVEALRAAGAVVVAKTNQHELGAGATGLISSIGPARNPWDPGRLPGGSSSGSAVAVAAGLVAMAVGSDTGGSIRMPAAFCGLTGLKTTRGRISLRGAMPMCPALDSAGPLARSAADCALAFRILAGHEQVAGAFAPALSGPVEPTPGLRVGLPSRFFHLVHPETRAAVERAARALEGLGAVVEEVEGPELDEGWDGFEFVWSDVAHGHRELWDDPGVHPEIAALVDYGRNMSGVDYAASRSRAEEVKSSFERALTTVDALLAPATPYPAPPIDAQEVAVEGGSLDVHSGSPSRLTVPVNLAGVPSLSFPVGLSSDGLPLGAQLIGRPWAEETLLAWVDAYQQATGLLSLPGGPWPG